MALITSSMRVDIARLYVSFFGRAPDAEGMEFWAQRLADGTSLASIADTMFATAPARSYYPSGASNETIVRSFYFNTLGRQPDAEGLAFWTAKFNVPGATPGSVINQIISVVASYSGAEPAGLTSASLFQNKVEVSVYYASKAGTIAGAATPLAGITSDPASVIAAKAAIDALFPPGGGGGGVPSPPPSASAEVTGITDDSGTVMGTIASGGVTDDTSLVVTGTVGGATAGASLAGGETVRVYDGATYLGTAVVTVVAGGQSTWSYSDGRTLSHNQTVSYTARVVTAAGDSSLAGAAYTATVDTAAPTTGAISLAVDTGSSNSDGVTSNGVINVSALEAGAAWQYTVNNGATWTTGTGSSFTLPPGNYAAGNVQVRQIDVAGNVQTASLATIAGALLVDTTAPTTGSIALASDTGSSSSDGVTSNGLINVSGLEANATWEYSVDNGVNWTNGAGSVFTLSAGSYAPGQVKVRQIDAAGNVQTASMATNASAIVVDQTAPATATLSLAADTGVSNADGITSMGLINVFGLEAGASWQYSVNNGGAWTTGSGNSFTLAQGTYVPGQVQVLQSDAAGNLQTSLPGTNAATIVVETTGPVGGAIALAVDTGASNSDGITSNGLVNVSVLEPGATWRYTVNGGGNWTLGTGNSFTLAPGSYAAGQILVRQTDVAGNLQTVSLATNASAIVVDNTAPTSGSLALAVDTGLSTNDGITSDGRVNVTGLEAGATWEYTFNSGTDWTLGTGTSFTLTQGSYAAGAIKLRQTDAAGNVQTATPSIGQAIVVDTTAPTGSAEFSLYSDTGRSSTDGLTYNGRLEVTGLEAGAFFQYTYTNGLTWAVGTGSSFFLPQGTYSSGTIQVVQYDAAGNRQTPAASSNATTIVVDNTPPITSAVLTLAEDTGSSSSDGVTSNTLVNVSGIDIGNTWQFNANGVWQTGTGSSFRVAFGSYAPGTIKVRQIDEAGNVQTAGIGSNTASMVFDVTPPAGYVNSFTFSADTGSSPTDLVTRIAAQDISGTYLGVLGAGEILQISLDSGSTWAPATTAAGGNWTLTGQTLISSNLMVGRVIDLAGNAGPYNYASYVLDTVAPARPSAPVLVVGNDTGVSSSDRITNVAALKFFPPTFEASVANYLFANGVPVASGNGILTSTALPSGTYSFTTKVVDQAGNESPESAATTMTIDTVAPTGGVVVVGPDTLRITSSEAGVFTQGSTSVSLTANTPTDVLISPYVSPSPPPRAITEALSVTDVAGNMLVGGPTSLTRGTTFDDSIVGTSANEIIFGFGGADSIRGGGGQDILIGGAGNNKFIWDRPDLDFTPSATAYDTVVDFKTGDRLSMSAVLNVATSTVAAGKAGVSISGLATFHGADSTLEQRLMAVDYAIGLAGPGTFAVWAQGADSFLFMSDGNPGIGIGDMLIKLVGLVVTQGVTNYVNGEIYSLA